MVDSTNALEDAEEAHIRRQLALHRAITGNMDDGPDGHARIEFTCGLCCVFAAALHDITGWEIVAEFDRDNLVHAWVLNEDGRAVDVNGVHDGAWARTPYSEDRPDSIRAYPRSDCTDMTDRTAEDYEWAMDIIESYRPLYGVEGAKPRLAASGI